MLWRRRVGALVHRPVRWWHEALLFFAGVALYSRVQGSLPANPSGALARGQALWDAEGYLHLHVELWLNRLVVSAHSVAVAANYFYVIAHMGVTVSVLVWLFVAHRQQYQRYRLVWVIASLIGLLVFWLAPTAPPRLLPNTTLVDTVPAYHTWGAYESGSLKAHADLLASMPSLHVAWAVWAGWSLYSLAGSRFWRWFGVAYPALTALDVLATANHDLFDVAGGYLVVVLGVLAVRLLSWALASLRHAAPPLNRRPVARLRRAIPVARYRRAASAISTNSRCTLPSPVNSG